MSETAQSLLLYGWHCGDECLKPKKESIFRCMRCRCRNLICMFHCMKCKVHAMKGGFEF